MTARVITLAEALKDHLAAQLGKTVIRRYAPYIGRGQLADERITVFPSSDVPQTTARKVDENELVVGVEVAQTLPESGDQKRSNPDADINQLTFLDARMETVNSIKALFRDDGTLRETEIGSCIFIEMSNAPIYSLNRLIEDRIFSSVVTLTFMHRGSD